MMLRKQSLCMLLMVCLLVAVVVDLVVTMRLAVGMRVSAAQVCKQPALPCGAIPTRFVLEEPECADKLLKSMCTCQAPMRPSRGGKVRCESSLKSRRM